MARRFLPPERFRRPYCPKGHHKPDVGVIGAPANPRCYRCALEGNRRANARLRAKKRAAEGRPPNGQDGGRFLELRLTLGMTQRDFARAIGVSDACLREWEKGRARLKTSTVERVVPRVAALLSERNRKVLDGHAERADRERHSADNRAGRRRAA